jgi:hypothetical protein
MTQSSSEPARNDGPFPLSRRKRVCLAIVGLLLLALHQFMPILKFDSISLALLAFVFTMFFARINKFTFPWLQAETEKALRDVVDVPLPSIPETPPAEPVVVTKSASHRTDALLAPSRQPDNVRPETIHTEPGDLWGGPHFLDQNRPQLRWNLLL